MLRLLSLKTKLGLIGTFIAGLSLLCYYLDAYPVFLMEIGRKASLSVIIAIWAALLISHFSIILWDKKIPTWLSVLLQIMWCVCFTFVFITLRSYYSPIGIIGGAIFLILVLITGRRKKEA